MKNKVWLAQTGPFPLIWFSQSVSMLGSGLTGFGLSVWVFQKTQSVTQFALISFFAMLPQFLVTPLAGALVDRWDRRWTMIISDSCVALCSLALGYLVWSDQLATWHIYVLSALMALCGAFHGPAMIAATTLIVPRAHLGRASGMTQTGVALAQVGAPFLAGILLARIGLFGLILIDLVTALFAVGTLLVVHIPKPPVSAEGKKAKGSLASESVFGWRYIRARPGLFGLLVLLATTNFSLGVVQALFTPLVLSFSSPEALGVVLGVASCGMVAGGLLMTMWSPKRRVNVILGAFVAMGSILFLGGLKPNAVLAAVAGFGFLFMIPVVISCSQAIWQSKVQPDVQGRVFAFRRFIAGSMTPIAFLVAGPLADYVFEPLLMAGGGLAGSVGLVIGVGAGRGVGFLLILMGILNLLAVAVASRYPRLRRVEEEVPDADAGIGG